MRNYDELRIIEIPFKNWHLPPIEIKAFALVRDINYTEGLRVVFANPGHEELIVEDLDFNAICLVHDSVFKFPSSFLMQDDVQEQIIKQEADKATRKVYWNQSTQGEYQGN